MNNNIDTIDLEDELFEHFLDLKFPRPSILAIDKYLMSLIQNATTIKYKLQQQKEIFFVNDATVKSNYKVKANDVVRVMLTHPP
jgi:23S rRNA pseudouridine1911/1915/1917 synthase